MRLRRRRRAGTRSRPSLLAECARPHEFPGFADLRRARRRRAWVGIALALLLHGGTACALWVAASASDSAPGRAALPIRLLRLAAAEAPKAASPSPPAPAPKPVAKRRAPPKPAPPRQPTRQAVEPAPAPIVLSEPSPSEWSEAAAVGAGPAAPTASAAAPGGPAAGASAPAAGAPDPMAAYVAAVRGRIADEKRYPRLALERGVTGTVVVLLSIAADGRLEALSLQGSPPAVLAAATRDAVDRAAPFPPPPAGAARVRVPVDYRTPR